MKEKKVLLTNDEISNLVKKSLFLFIIGGIILLIPVIIFTVLFVDAYLYDTQNFKYLIILLSGLLISAIFLLMLILKASPNVIRKKYANTFKLIVELPILSVSKSRHEKVKNDSTVGSYRYTLYYMKLSNKEDYLIDYNNYKDIQEKKIQFAKLETAEKTGKTIRCSVVKSESKNLEFEKYNNLSSLILICDFFITNYKNQENLDYDNYANRFSISGGPAIKIEVTNLKIDFVFFSYQEADKEKTINDIKSFFSNKIMWEEKEEKLSASFENSYNRNESLIKIFNLENFNSRFTIEKQNGKTTLNL